MLIVNQFNLDHNFYLIKMIENPGHRLYRDNFHQLITCSLEIYTRGSLYGI